ncbi:MAG: hypothetical protein ACR2PK_07435 [Acidimicrobiales bacterium]
MSIGDPMSPIRRTTRRVVIIAVIAAQLTMVAVAYDSDHKTFGFQMFPESSRWQAEIVRVSQDGTAVSVSEDWEYRWSELVRRRGLTNPFIEHHADSGLRNQFGYFQGALDWVARNTPADQTTVYLEATVTYTNNGRGPFVRTFRSVTRDLDAP